MQGIADEGTKSKGRGSRTWNECVNVYMKRIDLVKKDAHDQNKWRSMGTGNHPTLPQCGNDS